MKELEISGDFDAAKEIIEASGHTGSSNYAVVLAILNFSKKGPEFFRKVEGKLSEKDEEFVSKLEEENKIYAQKKQERKHDGGRE